MNFKVFDLKNFFWDINEIFSWNFLHRLQTSSCFRWKPFKNVNITSEPLHSVAWILKWFCMTTSLISLADLGSYASISPPSPSASHVVNNSHRSSLKDFTVNLWLHELRFIFPKEIYAESDHVTSWNRKGEITLSKTMIRETYPLHLMQGYCESDTDNASASYVEATSGDFEFDGSLKFDLWEQRLCSQPSRYCV